MNPDQGKGQETPRWRVSHNSANGELHEWEVWADDEYDDIWMASCPAEWAAQAIIEAHNSRDALEAKLAIVMEALEQLARYDWHEEDSPIVNDCAQQALTKIAEVGQ